MNLMYQTRYKYEKQTEENNSYSNKEVANNWNGEKKRKRRPREKRKQRKQQSSKEKTFRESLFSPGF
jgi:hypothetical protein